MSGTYGGDRATKSNGRARRVILALAIWTAFGLTVRFAVGAMAAGPSGPFPGDFPPQPRYINTGEISGPADPDLAFESPTWVTTDSEGAVYVVDIINDHVQKYTAEGGFIDVWGAPDGPPIDGPIDAGPNDEIYIANWLSDQIEVYDPDGVLLRSWALPDCNNSGGAAGGIAVGSYGYVYVTDTSNHRVLQFTSTGTLLNVWGDPACQPGAVDGEFEYPAEIAVDNTGRVYVNDSFNDRIQVFEAAGFWVDTWYNTAGRFDTITALAADDAGSLYAVSLGAQGCLHCVMQIDSTGSIVNEWARFGSEPDEFLLPQDIAFGPAGDMYLVDATNDRVQRFTTEGDLLDLWSDAHRGRLSEGSYGMALDADGNLYLAEQSHGRVQVLKPDGDFQFEFGRQGSGAGQIQAPVDLAISPDGYVYTLDQATNRVVKYEQDGTYVTEWAGGSLSVPWGIAVDADSFVYVADSGNDLIQKFDSTGALQLTWGQPGKRRGEFDFPTALAVDEDRVYVADQNNHRVQAFDRNGAFIGMRSGQGSGPGQFLHPAGVAVDATGTVFVADTENHRVQMFTPDGRYLTQFTADVEAGEDPFTPWSIEVSADGTVYVLDIANQKVEIFELQSLSG